MMELFYLYGLVFLVLVVKSEYIVIASLDEEALLSCDSKVKEGGCHRVQWVKYATGVRSVIFSMPKSLNFPDAERVKLRLDENGTHFVYLTKLQQSDEGLYSCEIWSGWNCIYVQNTTLKIKECKILQAVKAAQGTTVNLSCPLDETTTTQRGAVDVSWVKLKAAKTVPITTERAEINGSSLSFRPVSEEDTSWYRCSYKHEQVQRCYEINLHVKSQGRPSGTANHFRVENEVNVEAEVEVEAQYSSRAVAAAVTVVLLSIAMTVALVGFLLHRRRNSQTPVLEAQRHPTGADIDFYMNCESMDCTVYNHISIYHEIPPNPTEN